MSVEDPSNTSSSSASSASTTANPGAKQENKSGSKKDKNNGNNRNRNRSQNQNGNNNNYRNKNNQNRGFGEDVPEFIKAIWTETNNLDKKIRSNQDKINDRKVEREAIKKALNGIKAVESASNEFRTVLEEKKKVDAELKTSFQQFNSLMNEIRQVQASIEAASGRGRDVTIGKEKRVYRDRGEIDSALADCERRQRSTTSAKEEGAIIKEMKSLEAAKKEFASFEAQRETLSRDRDRKTELQKALDKIKKDQLPLKQKQKELGDTLDKVNTKNNSAKTELITKKDELAKENEADYEEIIKLRERMDALAIEEREKRREWEAAQVAQKEEKKLQEEKRKEDLIKKYEQEFLQKHPFETEMKICDELVTYLQSLALETTATSGSDCCSSTAPTAPSVQKNRNHESVGSFFDDSDEEGVGYKKALKKKKNKKGTKGKAVSTFQIDIDVMTKFSQVQCGVPIKEDQVSDALEEVNTKKEWFASQPRPEKIEITLDANEQPIVRYPGLKNGSNDENDENSGEGNGEGKSSTSKSTPSKEIEKGGKTKKPDVQSSEQFPSLSGK